MQNTLRNLVKSSKDAGQGLVESGIFANENIITGAIIIFGALLIQFFFPPGTRSISRKTWSENFGNFYHYGFWSILGLNIDPKYLREYRCPNCDKLLAKGSLRHKDDVLEVKCRGCSAIHMFRGEDADIIEKRSVLLREGKIPDPELAK